MKGRYKFSRLSQLPLSGDSQPMQYTHSSYIQTAARLLIYCLLMNGFDEGRQRAKVHKFPVKMSLGFLMSKFGFLPPTQYTIQETTASAVVNNSLRLYSTRIYKVTKQ